MSEMLSQARVWGEANQWWNSVSLPTWSLWNKSGRDTFKVYTCSCRPHKPQCHWHTGTDEWQLKVFCSSRSVSVRDAFALQVTENPIESGLNKNWCLFFPHVARSIEVWQLNDVRVSDSWIFDLSPWSQNDCWSARHSANTDNSPVS